MNTWLAKRSRDARLAIFILLFATAAKSQRATREQRPSAGAAYEEDAGIESSSAVGKPSARLALENQATEELSEDVSDKTQTSKDIPEICGTEPHSDVGGFAVVFGIGHRTESAAACCQACQDHAEKMSTEGKPKPCNSWVFCPEPVCWGLDTGWNHTFGECWLKWQEDPSNPIYGQRGLYTEDFHQKYKSVRGGPPKAVPWIGGVMGQPVDHSKQWMTGPKGIQAATGEKLRVWRAWLNDFEPEK
mmetsp:Transcript_12919/g.24603  ORF Transcript_12919/g.24603 Transcript_12919/m.24603 type:complete len:246 (+) Transcript_12919:171-908(+)|eukprot:CAMPEP_0114238214 /NCGR_PEP_ID=MMETSP0058-20121206/7805_1 /TAXON_ID=36894 /ORGANISM="Pyramimonas parkeae, CCMP726" /LENGTH=245 /DNA_ID=CAMNT_0001350309 /DNA_START=118 /DNA_END=855 /DNA_ORIENTATION=-